MKTFEYSLPTKIIFGNGEMARAGKLAKPIGHRALLVTGKNAMRETGILNRLHGYLETEGIEVTVFDEISPNPRVQQVDSAAVCCRRNQCDVIIGLGGGSAMDAAKAVAVAVRYGKPVSELMDGDITPASVTLPVITIPTTAGSGAEVTRRAILSDPVKLFKQGLQGDGLFPRIAIVDPELTLSVPQNITAETGFDVLCHAIETFVSTKASPLTRAFSEKAIKTVYEVLPKLVRESNNLDLRARMMFASVIMGFNLANASTCLPHRLQYPIGAHTDTSHSAGLVAIFPVWLKRLVIFAPQKVARIGRFMGVETTGLSELEVARKSVELVESLLNEIGLNTRLRDMGITFEECSELAKEVTGNVAADVSFRNQNDILELYQAAW